MKQKKKKKKQSSTIENVGELILEEERSIVIVIDNVEQTTDDLDHVYDQPESNIYNVEATFDLIFTTFDARFSPAR